MIRVGMDFNVGKMAAVCAVYDNGRLHCFKEFVGIRDTPDMVDVLAAYFQGEEIAVYPDSSGRSTHSTDAGVSDFSILKRAGFRVKSRTINPPVRDRVAAVNMGFTKKKISVDLEGCPELVDSLETMVLDESGVPDKDGVLDHVADALGYMVCYLMPVRSMRMKPTQVLH